MPSRLQGKVRVITGTGGSSSSNLAATAYFNRLEDISDEEWDRAPRGDVDLFRRDEGLVAHRG